MSPGAAAQPPFVLALDQGTTSSRAILFDRGGRPVASAQRDFPQGYPFPGHVTHDPEDIWESQVATAREALGTAGVAPSDVAAIGLANQRETTVVWDRATGKPVAPAIVWQSRVTADRCAELRAAGHEPLFRARTGLPLDPYFSGPKIAHILDSTGLRSRAEAGELCFGTVDTFLLWRLTGGALHATDVTNASRTLLFDIHRLTWDEELCRLAGVPPKVLPEVRSSAEIYGETEPTLLGARIPLAGVAGDQQAALFGQACFAPGDAKATYGTGAFLLANTGTRPVASTSGLVTTIAWRLGHAAPVYALEGSVFSAGAAVDWLQTGLRAISRPSEVEQLAGRVADAGGVYVVPAFTGLGAPYWDPHARGAILGLTRGVGLPEIARATLDSIALQVHDVVEAIETDLDHRLSSLRVDGGATANDLLLQLQADVLDLPVVRPRIRETTALGAAYLAGLSVGVWRDTDDLSGHWVSEMTFLPEASAVQRAALLRGWKRAVERARNWAAPDADM